MGNVVKVRRASCFLATLLWIVMYRVGQIGTVAIESVVVASSNGSAKSHAGMKMVASNAPQIWSRREGATVLSATPSTPRLAAGQFGAIAVLFVESARKLGVELSKPKQQATARGLRGSSLKPTLATVSNWSAADAKIANGLTGTIGPCALPVAMEGSAFANATSLKLRCQAVNHAMLLTKRRYMLATDKVAWQKVARTRNGASGPIGNLAPRIARVV